MCWGKGCEKSVLWEREGYKQCAEGEGVKQCAEREGVKTVC